MTNTTTVFGIVMLALVCPWGRAAETTMSPTEQLVFKLATADLSSERHALPGYAIERFAAWTGHILKEGQAERTTWRVVTVRKGERFEFIHAETDGFSIRQLPEIVMLGFTPQDPRWQENVKETVLHLLKTNVQGEWDRVRVVAPKKIQDVVFLETDGGFSETVGTSGNSFVAVVVGKGLWVCLPKRLAFGGPADYGFVIETNKRWFSQLPGGR
jgi:hypothetical protein